MQQLPKEENAVGNVPKTAQPSRKSKAKDNKGRAKLHYSLRLASQRENKTTEITEQLVGHQTAI